MRPIKLTMAGFGPYAGEQVLEMDKLGTKGIVLITGPTGAGKTSIYDAMMFALYGEASGENRTVSMLRSKYADASAETYVELEFEHKGKVYTIRRNPEYERKKVRGDGTTTQPAGVSLICPGKNPITGNAEVKKEILEIIGLDREQFVRVSMIAQGEFRKLLQADTQERQKIFRGIFNTGLYGVFQLRLKEECSKLQSLLNEKKLVLQTDINRILTDDASVYADAVAKAKAGRMATTDVMELLDCLLEQDRKAQEKVKAGLERIGKEEDALKANAVQAQMQQKAKADLAAAKLRMEELVRLTEAAEQEVHAAELTVPEKERLDKEAAALETLMPRYRELEEKSRRYEEAQKAVAGVQALLQDMEARKESSQSILTALKEEQKTLENIAVKRAEKISEKDREEEKARRLSGLIQDVADYEAGVRKLEIKQQEFLQRKAQYDELRHSYETANEAFLNAQAGIIAAKLEPGKPCPVCGAAEHPAPAGLSEDAPEESVVKQKKDAAEAAARASEQASAAAGEQSAVVKMMEDGIAKKAAELLGVDSVEQAKEAAEKSAEALQALLQELGRELRVMDEKVQRNTELSELITKKEAEWNELIAGISKQNEQLAALGANLSAWEVQISEIRSGLKHPDKAAAEAEKLQLVQRSSLLEQNRKNAQEKLNRCNEQTAGNRAAISQLEKQLEGVPEIDVCAIEEAQAKLAAERQKTEQTGQQLYTSIFTNEEVKAEVGKSEKEIAALETRWGWMKPLSDTANGTVSGKDKVMLETYIQTVYFDSILQSANVRLSKMSGGQYSLVRRKSAADKRGQSGLELNIIDHINGNLSERSVNTLSGGEAFLASLALALGLSDVIQSSTGISLDTLYVDEGFGSLDSDTLNVAYGALAGLTEDNRLVGIISHVAELKERIDKRIEVAKKPDGGSVARIVL